MFKKDKEKAVKRLEKAIQNREADLPALNLLNILNVHPDYFTTSSCYGRIMLINSPGDKKEASFIEKWHSTVKPEDIEKVLEKGEDKDVWIKCDPFILHISCKDLEAAKKILEIKNKCGVKRGGIFHIKEDRFQVELQGTNRTESFLKKDNKRLVDSNYVKEIVEESNKRFVENTKRWAKLEKEFAKL